MEVDVVNAVDCDAICGLVVGAMCLCMGVLGIDMLGGCGNVFIMAMPVVAFSCWVPTYERV